MLPLAEFCVLTGWARPIFLTSEPLGSAPGSGTGVIFGFLLLNIGKYFISFAGFFVK